MHNRGLIEGRLPVLSVCSSERAEAGTYSKSLEGRDDTVGETGDGTLGQIGDDVGNGIRLGSEETVDFL